MDLFKVIILGVILCLLCVLLKQIKPEYALICMVVGSILLLILILDSMQNIFVFFNTIIDKTGINNQMFSTMLKIIGVGYMIEFASGICNDTGNSSIGDKIVFAGRIIIFTLSIPIIKNLFNLIMDLV